MIREELKKEILEKVPEYDSEQVLWSDIREFMDLVEERDGFRVFDKAIQAALDQYQCVKIPEMGETLYLDAPLIMTNLDGSPTAEVDAIYFRDKR